jgi:hypothetical protein
MQALRWFAWRSEDGEKEGRTVEILKPGETAILELVATDGPASSWRGIPDGLVTLAPSADGMSCTATAVDGQVGNCTVKAFGKDGRNAVGYFSIQLVPPVPVPRKPVQIRPTSPTTPAAAATTSPATSSTVAAPASNTPSASSAG